MRDKDFFKKKRVHETPVDELCIRLFSRELKTKLLGYCDDKPEYNRVADKIYAAVNKDRTNDVDVHFPKTNWHDYWYGKRMPKPKYYPDDKRKIGFLCAVELVFPGLVKKWLYRGGGEDRLQLHLNALELSWISANNESLSESVFSMAGDIILAIHGNWRPFHNDGSIRLPASLERKGLDLTVEKVKKIKYKEKYIPDVRASKPVSLERGPTSSLMISASWDVRAIHQLLHPISVIPYLLSLAVETKLSDTGLKEAFILDFLSAVAAASCIIKEITAEFKIVNPLEFGEIFGIYNGCVRFFWDEDYECWGKNYKANDPVYTLSKPSARLLGYVDIDHDFYQSMDLMYELKDTYYAVLSKTGLRINELLPKFQACMSAARSVTYKADKNTKLVKVGDQWYQ